MKAQIVRRWHDRISTEDRDRYARYFAESGAPAYRQAIKCLGFELLYRDCDDGTSVVETLSWWASEDAVAAFAGPDFMRARYFARDDEFLLDRPERVEHFEIAAVSPDLPEAWHRVTLLGEPGAGCILSRSCSIGAGCLRSLRM